MTTFLDLCNRGSLLAALDECEHGGPLLEAPAPPIRLCQCPDLCPLHYRGRWSDATRRIDAMRGNRNAEKWHRNETGDP